MEWCLGGENRSLSFGSVLEMPYVDTDPLALVPCLYSSISVVPAQGDAPNYLTSQHF